MDLDELHEQLKWVQEQMPMIAREESILRTADEPRPKRRQQSVIPMSKGSRCRGNSPRKTRARSDDATQVSRTKSVLRPRHSSKISKNQNQRKRTLAQNRQPCAGPQQTPPLQQQSQQMGADPKIQIPVVSLRRSNRLLSAQKSFNFMDRPLQSPKISKRMTKRHKGSWSRHMSTVALREEDRCIEPKVLRLDSKAKRISSRHAQVAVRRSGRICQSLIR